MPQPAPSSPSRTPLTSAQSVRFSYGATPVFENLDLAIPTGLTLLHGGESCGKSTLLRLLAGALRAEKGRIEWHWIDPAQFGQALPPGDIYWMDPRDEQYDQVSAQSYFDRLQARHTGFSRSSLQTLTQELGLSEHVDKPLYMLSTGSKRKVWLTGAFASHCRLTLLDEPFAALDQRSVACVRNWLNRVAGDTDRAWVVADYEAPPGVAFSYRLALDAIGIRA
jgi:ATPase subunit of ABC transporter with duplicated ATPase domains